MSPEALIHVEAHMKDAENYTSDVYKAGMAAIIGGSIALVAGVTISDAIDKANVPLLEGAWKEAASNTAESLGIYGAGLFALAGVCSVGKLGIEASYHRFKVWQIQRREAKAAAAKPQFTWPLYPENSQLNINLWVVLKNQPRVG